MPAAGRGPDVAKEDVITAATSCADLRKIRDDGNLKAGVSYGTPGT